MMICGTMGKQKAVTETARGGVSSRRNEYDREEKRPRLKPPLPTIEGVSPSCLRLPSTEDRNILEYLGERFPKIEAKTWIERMRRGRVVDGSGNPLNPESRGRRGSYVFYYRELEEEAPIPFEERILYRDDHILAVDKPHFLPVVPSGRLRAPELPNTTLRTPSSVMRSNAPSR